MDVKQLEKLNRNLELLELSKILAEFWEDQGMECSILEAFQVIQETIRQGKEDAQCSH